MKKIILTGAIACLLFLLFACANDKNGTDKAENMDTTFEHAEFINNNSNMNYCIRILREDEQGILADFLYEAIYIPEGVEAPARNIIEQPELQLYISDWGKETMKYM